MGKPRRKVRHRSIEWFERDVPGKHMDEVEFCRVAAGHFPASRHFSAPTWSPGRFSLALDVGGKICLTICFLFYIFCLLLHRLAIRISLPCHIFLQVVIVMIQVYNLEIRHHSLVCCCGLGDILYTFQGP